MKTHQMLIYPLIQALLTDEIIVVLMVMQKSCSVPMEMEPIRLKQHGRIVEPILLPMVLRKH